MRAEKPHIGWSGVPFMNRITGFSAIALWIASRIWVLTSSLMRCSPFPLPGLRLDGERVDPAADLGAEHVVDEPVLGDPGQALERGRRRRPR